MLYRRFFILSCFIALMGGVFSAIIINTHPSHNGMSARQSVSNVKFLSCRSNGTGCPRKTQLKSRGLSPTI